MILGRLLYSSTCIRRTLELKKTQRPFHLFSLHTQTHPEIQKLSLIFFFFVLVSAIPKTHTEHQKDFKNFLCFLILKTQSSKFLKRRFHSGLHSKPTSGEKTLWWAYQYCIRHLASIYSSLSLVLFWFYFDFILMFI